MIDFSCVLPGGGSGVKVAGKAAGSAPFRAASKLKSSLNLKPTGQVSRALNASTKGTGAAVTTKKKPKSAFKNRPTRSAKLGSTTSTLG